MTRARLLAAVALCTASIVAGPSCAALGGCVNGVYGPPSIQGFVLDLPAGWDPARIHNPPGDDFCAAACGADAVACELATPLDATQPFVVCLDYVAGGCPSGWR